MELSFFEAGIIAISEVPIGCFFIVLNCIIIGNKCVTENEKLRQFTMSAN